MSQNPFEINGGALAAMVGKNCVAMASDKRLGVQYQTVATNYEKVYKMQDNIMLGLTGLASDCITL